MKYGLTSAQFDLILATFERFPEVEKVVLFGSRAMGNQKPSSDVDLFVSGHALTDGILARLSGCLNEETSVPFQFDLLKAPLPEALQEHIDQYGIVIFERL